MVGAVAEQGGEDAPLQVVGVLELIDEGGAEALAHRGHELGVVQGIGQAPQEILVAQGPPLLEALDVGGAHPGSQLPPGLGVLVGGAHIGEL